MSLQAPKNNPFPQKKWRQYANDRTPHVWRPLRDTLRQCDSTARSASHRHHAHAEAAEAESYDSRWNNYTIGLPPLSKWLRRFIGVSVLLPAAIICTMALFDQLTTTGSNAQVWYSIPVWYTIMGVLVWAILGCSKLFTDNFLYLYVLGHELTHAFAAVLCLGGFSGLQASIDGGEVQTSKNNIFIALAPYFIPLWAMVWAGLFMLVNIFYSLDDYQGLLYGGIGFWWAFNLSWTAWIIPKDQPDLRENGIFFSLMFVYLANQIVLILMLMLCNLLAASNFITDFCKNAETLFSLVKESFKWLISLAG